MPREDGRPTINELTIDLLIEEAGKEGIIDGKIFLSDLKIEFGREPYYDEIVDRLGIDRRRYKPWPPEDDCKGCDRHIHGPHRFSCHVFGKNQMILPASFDDDGILKIKLPK